MTTDTTGELGTILGIWAHPDDETWASAGLMARAVDAGRRVVVLTATRGEAGFPDDDTRSVAERAAVRESELAASLAVLGLTEHRWMGYADGGCAGVPDDEAAAAVAAVIDEVRPDTILTFAPDGGTGHPDHISVCRWTTMAVAGRGQAEPRLLYATKSRPWSEQALAGIDPAAFMMIDGFVPEAVETSSLAVWLTCDDALLDRKVAALRAQWSQIEPTIRMVGADAFRAMNREEFFREPAAGDPERLAAATAFSRRTVPR